MKYITDLPGLIPNGNYDVTPKPFLHFYEWGETAFDGMDKGAPTIDLFQIKGRRFRLSKTILEGTEIKKLTPETKLQCGDEIMLVIIWGCMESEGVESFGGTSLLFKKI